MPPVMPEGYYASFEPTLNHERRLWRAGKVLQARELNDAEIASQDRLKRVADVLFKDGAVVRDGRIFIQLPSGATTLEAGVLYVRGAMRGVAPLSTVIPVTGVVVVGVYLQEEVVTENHPTEGAALRDPAIGARNYGEPGAARLKAAIVWGVQGDGQPGEFYPVYRVVDGQVEGQNPPPSIDAIAIALRAYDRQSTGGYYVSSGLNLTKLADEGANQIYSLSEGVARVDGAEVTLAYAKRVVFPAVPDLKQVLGEPHTAAGGTETITVRHAPISVVDQVLIRSRKHLSSFTRGPASGTADTLPDSPVLAIVAVNQGGTWNGTAFTGGTTYVQGTDYKLTGDTVDWSLSGTDPAPGSTYQVVYDYTASVAPANVTETGFQVTGAVVGSTTTVHYRWKRPRYDRLCLTPSGGVDWVVGVPNDTLPIKPMVPGGLLPVASVLQTWRATRAVENDGVRLVPMNQLERMQGQIDDLFNVVSDHQLRTEVAITDPTTKKGIFSDPCVDDSKRDQGAAQTAAVFDGIMTLPMTNVNVAQAVLEGTKTLPPNPAGTFPVIQQPLKTGDMKVNPYDAFNPIPGQAVLEPAVDFWTQRETAWASPITRQFEIRRTNTTGPSWGLLTRFIGTTTAITVENVTEVASVTTRDAQFLRPLSLAFTLKGFGPGENLTSVKFDGRTVAFTN